MSRFQPPKSILDHPGVAEVDDGYADSDYRYDILLKPGWHFTHGRMSGCRTLLCHTVANFRAAKPKRKDHG